MLPVGFEPTVAVLEWAKEVHATVMRSLTHDLSIIERRNCGRKTPDLNRSSASSQEQIQMNVNTEKGDGTVPAATPLTFP
jgi:hypothetical protein